MGSNSHLTPKTEFAHLLNAYFKKLVDDRGWDATGRKMEKAVEADEPKRNLWAKFYADTQAMNTNEIQIAARVFEMTPYQFVSRARLAWLANVGDLDEDGRVLTQQEEEALRRGDVDLAALRGQNQAEIPHAE